jgi:trans-aconitate methyltransferase
MLHPRVIFDLCRFPMWLINGISIAPNRQVTVDGWALPDRGDLMVGEIVMNRRKADFFQWRESPDMAKAFKWHENTEVARFRAVFHNVDIDTEEMLRFSYVGRWSRDPFNRWQDIYFPLQAWRNKLFAEPDGPRMKRTQGNTDFFWYVLYGTTAAEVLNEVTKTYFGKGLADFRDICDWGCGCARVVQAVHRIAPKANIVGLDIDQDNITWCQGNIPYAQFEHVPLFPPTDIPDGRFDLLYGISVFTHLTRQAFEAWRDELHRLVRPGGVVLVTVNRGASLVRMGNEELIVRALATGFDDTSTDHALDDQIGTDTYYRGTFLSTAEAMRIFGTRFRVRDIASQANGTSQDLVVCERI